MANIAFLMKESHMGYEEIMRLPYSIFLSLLKHFQLMNLNQNPEYRKQMEKEKLLKQTEPDWERLKPLTQKEVK